MAALRNNNGQVIETLHCDDVVRLHTLLTSHPEIQKLTEPVSPTGVKDMGLLESAVARQSIGFGTQLIYDNPYSNCATLVFGVACNHGFHNGNKRAALLCLIMHLYRNGYVLKQSLNNIEIYEFLRSVASHGLKEFSKSGEYKSLYNSIYKYQKLNDIEADIKFMEFFIKKFSESKQHSNRHLKWNLLIAKLEQLGIAAQIDGSKITLTQETGGLFNRKRIRSYPYNSSVCTKYLLGDIRGDFHLRDTDGLDGMSFYSEEIFLDEEIVLNKKAIYKLSKA